MGPLVVHVLPVDIARGAQRYARALRDALDGRGPTHRTLTIFESSARVLDADVKLNVPRALGRRAGYEPRATFALDAALRKLAPRIVVAHGSEPLKYLATLPLAATLVYYKIGVATASARQPIRRLLHAAMLLRPRWVAGVSEACLEEAASGFWVPRRRLVLIPNGRDAYRFRPGLPRGGSGPPVLAFVGHLTESKRPGLFIDVVARLRASGVLLDALMIGEGPLEPSLAPLAAAAGVRMLGGRDDVPELLRSVDAFLFTSLPEGEGMPGVLIEAGLSGIPIVSTDVPGARDVIRDGETGFVVQPHRTDALFEGARALLTNEALRLRMGQAARSWSAAEYSMDRSIARWETLVAQILESRDTDDDESRAPRARAL